jgi:PAS domain-containing protein
MPTPDHPHSSEVFDTLDTGLIILDGACRVLDWNAWIASASGVPAGAARGLTLEEVFPGADFRKLCSAARTALDSGASSVLTPSLHPATLPLKTRSGRALIHNIAVRPLGDRPYARCLVQVTDVTAATDRERVLRVRLNARYDAVVESAPDPILTLDSAGLIQLANPACALAFGRPGRRAALPSPACSTRPRPGTAPGGRCWTAARSIGRSSWRSGAATASWAGPKPRPPVGR